MSSLADQPVTYRDPDGEGEAPAVDLDEFAVDHDRIALARRRQVRHVHVRSHRRFVVVEVRLGGTQRCHFHEQDHVRGRQHDDRLEVGRR